MQGQKALILFLFAIAVYVSLTTQNDSGLPNPKHISPAVWLYGTLALMADFMGGFPVVIAAGLTIALYWRAQDQKKTQKAKPKTNTNPKASTGKITGLQGPQGSPTPGMQGPVGG